MNDLTVIALLTGASAFLILARLAVVERRLARLSRLDAKVDALLAASGISSVKSRGLEDQAALRGTHAGSAQRPRP